MMNPPANTNSIIYQTYVQSVKFLLMHRNVLLWDADQKIVLNFHVNSPAAKKDDGWCYRWSSVHMNEMACTSTWLLHGLHLTRNLSYSCLTFVADLIDYNAFSKTVVRLSHLGALVLKFPVLIRIVATMGVQQSTLENEDVQSLVHSTGCKPFLFPFWSLLFEYEKIIVTSQQSLQIKFGHYTGDFSDWTRVARGESRWRIFLVFQNWTWTHWPTESSPYSKGVLDTEFLLYGFSLILICCNSYTRVHCGWHSHLQGKWGWCELQWLLQHIGCVSAASG